MLEIKNLIALNNERYNGDEVFPKQRVSISNKGLLRV